VPGGVRVPLTSEGRDKIRAWLPEAFATTKLALDSVQENTQDAQTRVHVFGNFPSLFMGLVAPDGSWEHHGGKLRFTDSSGSIIADQIEVRSYAEFIGEAVQKSSYLKSPYYLPLGFPDGMYRVGPLARLNVCERMGVPKADKELKNFKKLGRGAVTSSFLYHYARLIEILAASSSSSATWRTRNCLSDYLRADAGINNLRGVGASEAPRGTLFHDYTVDRNGLLQKVNLIVATGQNNLAMNRPWPRSRGITFGEATFPNRCSTASSMASVATTRA
jgi:NAD-reducing hydrogenase large subunit